jgi:peptide/nickel transport system substrate-binding protein
MSLKRRALRGLLCGLVAFAPLGESWCPHPVSATSATQSLGKTMTVCMTQEPRTLYTLSESTLVKAAVLEGVYDFGVDQRTYAYQPVGMLKLPNYADGDAGQYTVTVQIGDTVYDALSDAVIVLTNTSIVNLRQLDGSVLEVNFGISPTATTVQVTATWTLAEGLMWEDGWPVTTEDVLFAWMVAASPDSPNSKYIIERTAAYEALSLRAWRWMSLPGYVDSYYLFRALVTPLPTHRYGPQGSRPLTPAEMLQDAEVNRDPLAFGPFKVVEWAAGNYIQLVKNPTYHRASAGLPKLEQLIFRFYPDVNQLVAKVVAGECDLATQDGVYQTQLPLLRALENEGLLQIQMVAGTVYEHLDFNIMPNDVYTGFAGAARNDDNSPIFANAQIRKALAYCIDKQAVVDQALNGAGVAQQVYVAADHPYYAGDDNLNIVPFDPAIGLQLLADNGWTDSNGDGVLDKNGTRFSFVYSTRTNAYRPQVLPVIQTQLRTNCKIETTLAFYGGEFFADGPDGPVFGRKYDLAEFAWLTGNEPPCNLYTTANIPQPGNWGAWNNTGWSNAAFDTACDTAQAAIDPPVKRAQHTVAQQTFINDMPSIVLFARAKIILTRPGVSGVILDPTATTDLWNVENFDVPPYATFIPWALKNP